MISVVIPTYNEEKYVRLCLENLKKCQTTNYEVIIVDAKSTDKTVDICREYTDKILIEDKKEGLAIARNKGVEIATGDIVAFLDADSIPKDGWLDYIEKSMTEEVIAVGRLIEYGITWLDLYYKLYRPAFNFGFIAGNNSAWRNEIYNEFGGFRSVIGEDFDLCFRARKYSRKIKIIPKMKICLSTRRFDKEGILNTHYLWTKSNIFAVFGNGISMNKYKNMT